MKLRDVKPNTHDERKRGAACSHLKCTDCASPSHVVARSSQANAWWRGRCCGTGWCRLRGQGSTARACRMPFLHPRICRRRPGCSSRCVCVCVGVCVRVCVCVWVWVCECVSVPSLFSRLVLAPTRVCTSFRPCVSWSFGVPYSYAGEFGSCPPKFSGIVVSRDKGRCFSPAMSFQPSDSVSFGRFLA